MHWHDGLFRLGLFLSFFLVAIPAALDKHRPGCDLNAHFPGVHWISMETDQ